MFAVGDRFHHEVFRNAITTDQLDYDVDIRIRHHQIGVIDDFAFAIRQFLGALGIQVGHHRNLNRATRTPGNLFLVAFQYVECAGTDGSDTE